MIGRQSVSLTGPQASSASDGESTEEEKKKIDLHWGEWGGGEDKHCGARSACARGLRRPLADGGESSTGRKVKQSGIKNDLSPPS